MITPTVFNQTSQQSDEIADILTAAGEVYRCLYPDRTVRLVLHAASGDTWGQPKTLAADAPILGQTTLQPTTSAPEDVVEVQIAVPYPARYSAREKTEPLWMPPRLLAPVYARSPLTYERIRHRIEMWRKRRAKGPVMPMIPRADTVALPAPAENQRPAILVGMHWLEVGGAEKMAFKTVDWALAAGLRVFVVAGTAGAHQLANRLPNHPDVTFLRPDLYLKPQDWPRYLGNLIAANNIQLVHNHHCMPIYAALPDLAVAVPWVKHIDTTHIIENVGGGYPQVSARQASFIDLHHVISAALGQFLRNQAQVPGQVTLGRMLFDDTRAAATLPEVNMTAKKAELNVIFIGRLNYQKRPVLVVEAFRRLAQWAHKNNVIFRATLMGEGPFLDAVTALLARYGLTDKVTLAPANADAPTLLKAADVLLLPSSNEGLALVCYEAIEQGCIPLTTDVGAQAEIIPADLLLSVAPDATLRDIEHTVDRLWRDQSFLTAQQVALHERYQAIKADPTAYDVLMPLYEAVANGDDVPEA